MRGSCPKCGDTHLYAEKTKVLNAPPNKFDIYCRNCGYIGTGNVINAKTGDKIKDSDIINIGGDDEKGRFEGEHEGPARS